MEYTELADYPLPAGVVTEWTPTADEHDWASDDRRLSYAHLEHARRAVEIGGDWHSEWIGTAFRIGHRLDRDAMATTLRRWYARHEAFRSALEHTQHVADGEPAREDEFTRRIIAADKVDVLARRDAEPSSSTRVYLRIDHIFNTRITPLRWPHCLVVTVEPTDEDDSFLVVFGADHTVMDAYTQVFAIKELTRLYEAALTGQDDALGVFGSYLDFSHAERATGSRLGREDGRGHPLGPVPVATLRRVVREPADPMPAFPVAPDVDHDHTRRPAFRRISRACRAGCSARSRPTGSTAPARRSGPTCRPGSTRRCASPTSASRGAPTCGSSARSTPVPNCSGVRPPAGSSASCRCTCGPERARPSARPSVRSRRRRASTRNWAPCRSTRSPN